MLYTHKDIEIGYIVRFDGRDDQYTVTDVLDGWNGIGVTRSGDIHSLDRTFIDVDRIDSVGRW